MPSFSKYSNTYTHLSKKRNFQFSIQVSILDVSVTFSTLIEPLDCELFSSLGLLAFLGADSRQTVHNLFVLACNLVSSLQFLKS